MYIHIRLGSLSGDHSPCLLRKCDGQNGTLNELVRGLATIAREFCLTSFIKMGLQ